MRQPSQNRTWAAAALPRVIGDPLDLFIVSTFGVIARNRSGTRLFLY
jgi:hypothetical protein